MAVEQKIIIETSGAELEAKLNALVAEGWRIVQFGVTDAGEGDRSVATRYVVLQREVPDPK